MFAQMLKAFMPRSLFGRTALILLVPIITIQIVVSVVFIQRLYDNVTRQMTRSVVAEITYILGEITSDSSEGADARTLAIADQLGFAIQFDDRVIENRRSGFDLSGRALAQELEIRLDALRAVDLTSDEERVIVALDTVRGQAVLSFSRNRVTARNPHQLLVLMVATALLMTVIAFIYLRNQVRPIKRLAAAAEAFGKGRIVPYKPAGATEVRAAGGAFLDMRNRIERQIEQRTLMLSGVSHDLRTPLTRMKLALSMMDEGQDTEGMRRDVDDMEKMLEAFLDFARSDSLDDPAETDPRDILDHVLERAVRGQLPVTLGDVTGEGQVLLRPAAIERALDNLVGNAVRYGGRAVVGLVITDRAVRFSVEDDGPGIAVSARSEALKPFHRLDTARNQDGGSGVGLGLTIAADIARQHGGTLRLGKSESLGGLLAEIVLAR